MNWLICFEVLRTDCSATKNKNFLPVVFDSIKGVKFSVFFSEHHETTASTEGATNLHFIQFQMLITNDNLSASPTSFFRRALRTDDGVATEETTTAEEVPNEPAENL